MTGHRKPVPKFLPTPPLSPVTTATANSIPDSYAHVRKLSWTISSAAERPPLPADWRDVIERAVSSRGSTGGDRVSNHSRAGSGGGGVQRTETLPSVLEQRVTEANDAVDQLSEDDNAENPSVPRPETPIPWSRKPSQRKRRLSKKYRPPTPPIPSENEKYLPVEPDELAIMSSACKSTFTADVLSKMSGEEQASHARGGGGMATDNENILCFEKSLDRSPDTSSAWSRSPTRSGADLAGALSLSPAALLLTHPSKKDENNDPSRAGRECADAGPFVKVVRIHHIWRRLSKWSRSSSVNIHRFGTMMGAGICCL